jgi:hypothetical protein
MMFSYAAHAVVEKGASWYYWLLSFASLLLTGGL